MNMVLIFQFPLFACISSHSPDLYMKSCISIIMTQYLVKLYEIIHLYKANCMAKDHVTALKLSEKMLELCVCVTVCSICLKPCKCQKNIEISIKLQEELYIIQIFMNITS